MSTANGQRGQLKRVPPPPLPLLASNRQSIGKNKLWHVYSCIMLIKRHPMVAYSIYIHTTRPETNPPTLIGLTGLYWPERERERELSTGTTGPGPEISTTSPDDDDDEGWSRLF